MLNFHPRVWLNPILPAMPKLLSKILESALACEVEAMRGILRAQIENINFVQSHSKGREWFFYRIEKGLRRVPLGPALSLPNKETLWATIRIVCLDRQLESSVWVLNGRVGSISFDQPYNQRTLNSPRFKDIEIHSLQPKELSPTSWCEYLPKDLRGFSANGLPDGVVFMEPQETYLVETSEQRCALIGEVIDKGAILCPIEGEGMHGVYFCAYDGDELVYLGVDCQSAMERIQSGDANKNR